MRRMIENTKVVVMSRLKNDPAAVLITAAILFYFYSLASVIELPPAVGHLKRKIGKEV